MSENVPENKLTTAHLRRFMMDGLERASKGQLNYKDGQLMIGFANQTTHNMVAETKQREQLIRLGATNDQLGSLGSMGVC